MTQQVPHAAAGQVCPLHQKDVSEVCHKCPWWTRVIGKNPQSEELLDNWHCAIAILPMLLVENAQMQRQTGAALETLRNGVVEGVAEAVSLAADMAAGRLIGRRQ
jgi:predicted nucleic acid-binding protein